MNCYTYNSLNVPDLESSEYYDPEEHYFELQVSWYNTEREFFLSGDFQTFF